MGDLSNKYIYIYRYIYQATAASRDVDLTK